MSLPSQDALKQIKAVIYIEKPFFEQIGLY